MALVWREENTELFPSRSVIHFPPGVAGPSGRVRRQPRATAHSGLSFIYGRLSAAVPGDKVYEKRRRLQQAGRPALLSHTD